jgi:hypothetical protein
MSMFSTIGNNLVKVIQDIAPAVGLFLGNLIVALLVFIVGWIVAAVVAKAIKKLVVATKVDIALERAGFAAFVRRTGHNLDLGLVIATLVRWFVIIVFALVSFDLIGLAAVNQFLASILAYIPNVIVAVLMIVVAVLVSDFLQKVVTASARAANIKSAEFLGTVTRWSILVFALFAALAQLNFVAAALFSTIFTGIVIALSVAFGLAFGLGGQDAARSVIERITKK